MSGNFDPEVKFCACVSNEDVDKKIKGLRQSVNSGIHHSNMDFQKATPKTLTVRRQPSSAPSDRSPSPGVSQSSWTLSVLPGFAVLVVLFACSMWAVHAASGGRQESGGLDILSKVGAGASARSSGSSTGALASDSGDAPKKGLSRLECE